MAVTNRERVEKALDLLKAGLGPFVDREVKNAIKAKRLDEYGFHNFPDDPMLKGKPVDSVGRCRAAKVDVGHLERRLQVHARTHRA